MITVIIDEKVPKVSIFLHHTLWGDDNNNNINNNNNNNTFPRISYMQTHTTE